MRTTVEIPDEQRARLLELAAQRGEKGFSRLVQEAIARYLEELAAEGDTVAEAVAVLGTFDEAAAETLRERSRELRGRWR